MCLQPLPLSPSSGDSWAIAPDALAFVDIAGMDVAVVVEGVATVVDVACTVVVGFVAIVVDVTGMVVVGDIVV